MLTGFEKGTGEGREVLAALSTGHVGDDVGVVLVAFGRGFVFVGGRVSDAWIVFAVVSREEVVIHRPMRRARTECRVEGHGLIEADRRVGVLERCFVRGSTFVECSGGRGEIHRGVSCVTKTEWEGVVGGGKAF
ncbi:MULTISPECIES: hypothetical protein [unclassified Xanthobacter]|uniref:hypothetical protein n=1 Tax=unclassified Xanthobacter TaxID=2623496 RepID=UPI001F2CDD0A|nr:MULTISPECIES: hypothetical protein [unclassified Xanthobacter]